jgi:hypothetical protein
LLILFQREACSKSPISHFSLISDAVPIKRRTRHMAAVTVSRTWQNSLQYQTGRGKVRISYQLTVSCRTTVIPALSRVESAERTQHTPHSARLLAVHCQQLRLAPQTGVLTRNKDGNESRNIDARSRYKSCRGKAIGIAYSRWEAWNDHAQYHCYHLRPVCFNHIFSKVSQKWHNFQEGKALNWKLFFVVLFILKCFAIHSYLFLLFILISFFIYSYLFCYMLLFLFLLLFVLILICYLFLFVLWFVLILICYLFLFLLLFILISFVVYSYLFCHLILFVFLFLFILICFVSCSYLFFNSFYSNLFFYLFLNVLLSILICFFYLFLFVLMFILICFVIYPYLFLFIFIFICFVIYS